MKTEIYVAVRRGAVEHVRLSKNQPDGNPNDILECFVVDYDELENGGKYAKFSKRSFEKAKLGGRSWSQVEKGSVGVF